MNSYLYNFVNIALTAYWVLFIANFILSWIPWELQPLRGFVMSLTEPLLVQIRKLVPPMGGFDFSILIAILLINLLQSFVGRL